MGNRLAILICNRRQHRIGKEMIATLGKRPPRHELRPERLHHFPQLLLLVEHMCLDLIDGGNNFAKVRQIDKTVGLKIGNADSPRPVSPVIVIERLMYKKQIDIIALQLFQ